MERMIQLIWPMYVAAGLIGYLIGSLSFARIVTRLITKSGDVGKIRQKVPGTDQWVESDAISATTVGVNLGKKYGCLTSILDMLKVVLPGIFLKYYFPDQPYYLMTILTCILGHDYPIYHRFKGGGGESLIIGALLVINWFGIFVATGAAMILGYLTGRVMVMRYGIYLLMIFWYWIYFNDLYYVSFMILANVILWTSMIRDFIKYSDLIKTLKEQDISELFLMGKGIGRFLDNYGLPVLIRKAFGKQE
jgi:glycerol-3-phosphate acyltransferase PlsY